MARGVRYDRLPTEQRHPRSRALDQLPIPKLLQLMQGEDARVVRAVARQRPQITQAIRLITERLRHGGRLFFLGAGTSGRLGVLEAAECPPTFHTPPSLVQALMAGNRRAVFRSREGLEDDRQAARRTVRRRVRPGDVCVGIAASGVTPYVTEGLTTAHQLGAATILVTCHPRASRIAHLHIAPAVGPEILTGSTRLKAGTATKLTLNMLTLGVMVQLGKTYGNLMVDVRPTSKKLQARALRIIRTFTQASPPAAARRLEAAHGRVKVAIVMARCDLSYRAACRQLAAVHGSLREALHHR